MIIVGIHKKSTVNIEKHSNMHLTPLGKKAEITAKVVMIPEQHAHTTLLSARYWDNLWR